MYNICIKKIVNNFVRNNYNYSKSFRGMLIKKQKKCTLIYELKIKFYPLNCCFYRLFLKKKIIKKKFHLFDVNIFYSIFEKKLYTLGFLHKTSSELNVLKWNLTINLVELIVSLFKFSEGFTSLTCLWKNKNQSDWEINGKFPISLILYGLFAISLKYVRLIEK